MEFELQHGHRLEWALLVPTDAAWLYEQLIGTGYEEDEEDQTWCIEQGLGAYSVVFETEPGSAGGGSALGEELSSNVSTIYGLEFSGYDDPDDGCPSITSYHRGTGKLIWLAESDEPTSKPFETFPGPEGVPCDDPFEFAEALGCPLRKWYQWG